MKTIIKVILCTFLATTVFITSIWGATKIINMIEENATVKVACYECNNVAKEGAQFCSWCGKELIPKCKQCGNQQNHNQNTNFCIKCGERLK